MSYVIEFAISSVATRRVLRTDTLDNRTGAMNIEDRCVVQRNALSTMLPFIKIDTCAGLYSTCVNVHALSLLVVECRRRRIAGLGTRGWLPRARSLQKYATSRIRVDVHEQRL